VEKRAWSRHREEHTIWEKKKKLGSQKTQGAKPPGNAHTAVDAKDLVVDDDR
jgi:hypothetical protein